MTHSAIEPLLREDIVKPVLDISIQIAVRLHDSPTDDALRRWASAACIETRRTNGEMTIRIVDEAEMRALNARYRNMDKTTNVLAFAFEDPPDVCTDILGDVIICAPVVAREAKQLKLKPVAHWAHMVIHGVLHLCGYDHQHAGEARRMQALENKVMEDLGFATPYEQ